MSPTRLVLIAFAAGLTGGITISGLDSPTLHTFASIVESVGTLWANAIRMTVVPLVVSLLISSVASASDVGTIGRVGGRALLLFIALLGVFAIFAAVVEPPLFAQLPIDIASTTSLGGSADIPVTAREGIQKLPGFGQWLGELLPANPIRAAADGTMLPLVSFCLLFALACTRTDPEQRQSLLRFLRAVSDTMLVLVRWIIGLAPIGVFALVLGLTARMGASAVGAFGYYILVICILISVPLFAMYPVVAAAARCPVRQFAYATFSAQAVAFSSRSSLASLPALIEGAEQRLGVPPVVAGFVLPLAVSTFKISAPISCTASTLFLCRLYGVELDPAQIALVVVTAVILSFSTPGIPSGGIVLMAPLFTNIGLPVEGIGILIALDVIPDIFKTTSNVTADMAVAVILGRGSKARGVALPPVPATPHFTTRDPVADLASTIVGSIRESVPDAPGDQAR
jgi:proton glutamate symport protein